MLYDDLRRRVLSRARALIAGTACEAPWTRAANAARMLCDSTFPERFGRNVSAHPSRPALIALDERGTESATLTYGELDDRARAVASSLAGRSAPHDRILLAFDEPLAFVSALIGCAYASRIGVPVAMPASGKHDKGRLARIAAVAADCMPALALTSEKLVANVWPFATGHGLTVPYAAIDTISRRPSGEDAPADDLFYLQYTSGSTGSPRGVRLSHRNLVANLVQIRDTAGYDTTRPFVTWLPHFHDMGLVITLLFPLYFGTTCYAMSPTAFLKRPLRWLEAISRYGAASTAAPNFALDVCTRRIAPEARAALDLRSLTTLAVGGETVRAATLHDFTEAFAPSGFARSALAPAYGLAEATVLATIFRSERGFGSLELADGTAVVSCGRPPAEMLVRIVDPADGTPVVAGSTGEIVLAGPSVADAYWSAPMRRVTLPGGGGKRESFLATGDLGAIIGGELAVAGRIKDVVIINGANHHASDIEATVLAVTGELEPAGCAAFGFGSERGERLVVALEISRAAPVVPTDVLGALRVAIDARHDVMLHDLVLLRPGNLPRTSSGKIRRYACRAAYGAGGFGAASAPAR